MNAGPNHDQFRRAIERTVERKAPGFRSTRIFRIKTLELLRELEGRPAAPVTPAGSEVDDDPFAEPSR